MQKLYFGSSLDTIKNVMLTGFEPGHILRSEILHAMTDARNSTGLNQLYKPAVMILEGPSNTTRHISVSEHDINVLKSFKPVTLDIVLLKINFLAPQLIQREGRMSPQAIFDMRTYRPSKELAKKFSN